MGFEQGYVSTLHVLSKPCIDVPLQYYGIQYSGADFTGPKCTITVAGDVSTY